MLTDTAGRALAFVSNLRREDTFLRHTAACLEYLGRAELDADPAPFAEIFKYDDLRCLDGDSHCLYSAMQLQGNVS